MIDCHVHVFPPEVVAHRESYLARDRWFELLYQNPKARLVDAEALVAAMDTAGVDRSILCGFPWVDEALCRLHNDYMADAANRFPDRLSWLGIVAPTRHGAIPESQRCFEKGAIGIGELNADAQNFDWREINDLRNFVDVCVESDRPVLLHSSEVLGHIYPGKGTATPEKLVHFLASFRNLKVVAAHWGGGLPFHELMPEIELVTSNVVYDSAASTYLYKPQIFRTVLDIVGPDRVLFGSDYPVLKMDRFLNRVRQIEWRDQQEREAVLGLNAERFFRIGDAETKG